MQRVSRAESGVGHRKHSFRSPRPCHRPPQPQRYSCGQRRWLDSLLTSGEGLSISCPRLSGLPVPARHGLHHPIHLSTDSSGEHFLVVLLLPLPPSHPLPLALGAPSPLTSCRCYSLWTLPCQTILSGHVSDLSHFLWTPQVE